MRKWKLALLLIFMLALFFRILPFFTYAIWGSDSGEYYYLTQRVREKGSLSFDYLGWGMVYPYFQGMEILTSALSLLHLPTLPTLLLLTPILSSLSIILIFLICREIFKSEAAGVIGAGFLAVVMPAVFVQSHPMPGSLGDLLVLFCIYLLIRAYKDRRFIAILPILLFSCIFTHHLSTYFLFLALVSIPFVRELMRSQNDTSKLKIEIPVILVVSVGMFIYWLQIPEFRKIIYEGLGIEPIFLPLLVAIGLLALPLVVKLRRKFKLHVGVKKINFGRALALYLGMLCICSLVMFFIMCFGVPGTQMKPTGVAMLYFTPLVIFISWGIIGSTLSREYKNWAVVYGWFLGIFLSLLLAVCTQNKVLLPYRHLQYLVEPVAIFVGLGLVRFFTLGGIRRIFPLAAAILILANAPTAYPPPQILMGFEEGTQAYSLEAAEWLEHVETNATIATDHRLSSMVFGFAHRNATWDYARKTFHANSWEECKEEIECCSVPAGDKKINYVLLDKDMKKGVALLQWEPAKPMSKEAIQKFNHKPFLKIYESGYSQLYRVYH